MRHRDGGCGEGVQARGGGGAQGGGGLWKDGQGNCGAQDWTRRDIRDRARHQHQVRD